MNDLQELSTFSHEINNSLTLIYGQIQCIEKTYDTLTGNDHWNRMKDDFSSLFDFSSAFPVFTSITVNASVGSMIRYAPEFNHTFLFIPDIRCFSNE